MANQKLSELYKVNDIQLKEVAKPESVTLENGRYRFEPLDKYFASKSGFQDFAQSIADKVAEAKVAADIAKSQHQETVTKNMMGRATKQEVDKSRSNAERLETIAEEMKSSEQSALTAYYYENDPRKMVEEYRNDVAPYFRYVLSKKEVVMAKARQAYMESIQEFIEEMEAIHGISRDIKEIRYEVTGVPAIGEISHTEKNLIRRPTVSSFPFDLQHEEKNLLEREYHANDLGIG